eukprot:TRINITY_DN1379_c0_g1_i1.p1 TRINITY_DN1379_c0_g1~~TRINITY_DN1379_c0_g1_i1.p1  ORF type:complete len:327 (-),score=52.50 TRINITY_DN1379_c0_g1_i1:820-1800(-)
MYNGIGLTTPRGSGTNGYITRNLSHVRKRRKFHHHDRNAPTIKPRKPNQEILEHERKRAIEVKVHNWAEEQNLYDGTHTEEQIEELKNKKREELKKLQINEETLHKSKESHKYGLAQQRRSEQIRSAINIDKDYVPGSAFDPEYHERKREERYQNRLEREKQRRIRQEERQARWREEDKAYRERQRERRERDKLRRAEHRETDQRLRDRRLKEREDREERHRVSRRHRGTKRKRSTRSPSSSSGSESSGSDSSSGSGSYSSSSDSRSRSNSRSPRGKRRTRRHRQRHHSRSPSPKPKTSTTRNERKPASPEHQSSASPNNSPTKET